MAATNASASQYNTLYTFEGATGAGPYSGVVAVGDDLYGVTVAGGSGCQKTYYFTQGCGVVFRITPNGAGYSESIVYNFRDGKGDGSRPLGTLLYYDGSLYGTTSNGGGKGCGGNGCGTIFKVTTTGDERLLHVFKGGRSDGSLPEAGLIAVDGVLYGTTTSGGSGSCRAQTTGCGTVFSITPSGQERLIYSFKGGQDGIGPTATLIADAKARLYGTTDAGGSNACQVNYGCGTVFRISRSGSKYVERILHVFKGGKDGQLPIAPLTLVNGDLFGTTVRGGRGCSSAACGTVFKIDKSGIESIVHAFRGGSDGSSPYGGLVVNGGAIYGVTSDQGGSSACDSDSNGCGTIFKLTPAANGYRKTTLYTFHGAAGAYNPIAGLTVSNNLLFGTAFEGPGCSFNGVGCGSTFSISP